MPANAALSYPIFEGEGIRLGVEIGAFPDHYTVSVLMNGARTSTTRRRALTDALKWGRQTAQRQLAQLGLGSAQLSLLG